GAGCEASALLRARRSSSPRSAGTSRPQKPRNRLSEPLYAASFRKERNLGPHGRRREGSAETEAGSVEDRSLPRLRRRLFKAGERRDGDGKSGVPGLWLRGLADDLVGYGTRAAPPLRR